MRAIGSQIRVKNIYLGTLLKMVGITYIAEFASGICRDAGFSALGTQVEMFGKLSILAVSAPVLQALLRNLSRCSCHEEAEEGPVFFSGPGPFPVHVFRPGRAEEAVEEPYALEDFNMEEIQRFLDSLDRDQTGGLSFGSVMKEIMDGNLGGVLGELAGRNPGRIFF